MEGCARTWTWTRDAQLKHRTWARRFAEEEALGTEKGDEHGGPRRSAGIVAPVPERAGGGKRRRRRRQRVDVHEPPPRMCLPCREKAAAIVEREVPCKVHGCTRSTVLDRESHRIYLNEVNTIPGFTSISMYPILWEASGLPLPDLVSRLVQLAVERHAERHGQD